MNFYLLRDKIIEFILRKVFRVPENCVIPEWCLWVLLPLSPTRALQAIISKWQFTNIIKYDFPNNLFEVNGFRINAQALTDFLSRLKERKTVIIGISNAPIASLEFDCKNMHQILIKELYFIEAKGDTLQFTTTIQPARLFPVLPAL